MFNFIYILSSNGELYHWGVKGMKWGVRRERTPTQLKIGLQFFAKKASSRKTVKVSKKEYAHVMSELATNITHEQKQYPTIIKFIGDHVYTFENNFDNTYRIIGRAKNPGARKSKGSGKK